MHRNLSIHSAARWHGRPGGMGLWKHRGGATVAGLYARCLPWRPAAVLARVRAYSQGGHSVFSSMASYHAGSFLLCLLPWDNQVFESGRILPQAARSASNRLYCSGKEPTWRKGRTCRAVCKPGGSRVPYANGFWVITRSPGHAAYWKRN